MKTKKSNNRRSKKQDVRDSGNHVALSKALTKALEAVKSMGSNLRH